MYKYSLKKIKKFLIKVLTFSLLSAIIKTVKDRRKQKTSKGVNKNVRKDYRNVRKDS